MKKCGFSLVELLVAVAIVGILFALAYPNYQHHVIESRRTDCMGVLTELSQQLERYYTENLTYRGATIPGNMNTCPINGQAFYNVSLAISTDFTYYRLTAEAIGGQEEDGDLSLDSNDNRGWGTRACWRTNC